MTFTRAIEVAAGDPVTSREMIALARAINDRIRSGIGDCAWRIGMFWFNLFRQVRNPGAGGFVFPGQAEFFELYQAVDPEHGVQWPQTGPGETEGANLANVMNQFVFGVGNLLSEEGRLSDETLGVPLWLTELNREPRTASEFWELAKRQRGAIDPVSFVQSVPALAAAQSLFQIVTPHFSPHGKSYGGFFPTPVQLDANCGTTPETGLGIASYEIFFTALSEVVDTSGFHGTIGTNGDGLPTVTYAGSCPLETEDTAAGHVLAMAKLPFAVYVAVNDGAGGYNVDRFDRTEWIEGPYTGVGELARDDDAGQLHRAVWQFASDFRGTEEERAGDAWLIEDVAFDFEAFCTRQYHLAPARGQLSGGEIEALYPTWKTASAPVANPGPLPKEGGGTTHAFAEGFVMTGMLVQAQGLAATAVLDIMDGETRLRRVTLEPVNGAAEQLVWFEDAPRPAALGITLVSQAQFTSSDGVIAAQAAEILEYKPNWWDFSLLLRLSATKGGDPEAAGVDGRGIDFPNAPELWRNYRNFGCIFNAATPGVRQQMDWVNDNPVFDAARRLTREMMRVVSRRQFLSYEVAGGKSILRFRRYATNLPGVQEDAYDLFQGLAPSRTPLESGALITGEEYVVRGTTGSIIYRGSEYGPDMHFTAEADHEFQKEGDCEVYVWNGIRSAALPAGWTNEWVMWIETKVYHPSESSIWKHDAYADYFAWNQRCHFYSGSMSSTAFVRHATYNPRPFLEENGGGGWDIGLLPPRAQADLVVVESPPGYNYAFNANTSYGAEEFYKSCQIYKAPYEVESAVIEIVDGREVIKLTFKDRFQAHEDAPATVSADPASWSAGEVQALRDEDYRTCDNALREYALHQADPSYHASWKVGDAGVNSTVQGLPDNPFGSVYPHFFFVKLQPEPLEDGNEFREASDARCLASEMLHAETRIRAMCEGFMDDRTSLEITCETGFGSMYDYRFSTLCFDAFNGSYVGAFPLAIREDNPPGFGPLVNTVMYAEVFNRLVKCVNKLNRARVPLPFTVECKTAVYNGRVAVTPDWTAEAPAECNLAPAVYHVKWAGAPPAADTLIDPGEWADCGGAFAHASAGISTAACPSEGGNEFWMETVRQASDYRVVITDLHLQAIPSAWRGLVQTLGGFIGTLTETAEGARASEVDTQAEASGCCPQFAEPCPHTYWDGSTGWANEDAQVLLNSVSCQVFDSGLLDVPTPPGGTFLAARETHSGTNTACGTVSFFNRSLTILTEAGWFITVPLEDIL